MHPEFELLNEKKISAYKIISRHFKHKKTGALFLNLENNDDNKVFAVSFKTPASDNTGIPHIMEHSVLCGSKKYPVKEPFVELIKGSLNTYLNAFTYPDKTCFPVASKNLKDLYNMADVYLDAVFYPNISLNTFKQEAWHYDILSENDEMTFKGVVYNEMKGAFSSPERILSDISMKLLFESHPYGFTYGGYPDSIINLTYKDFLNFHKKHYHPSNSFFYLYGNAPYKDFLDYVHLSYLKDFDKKETESHIPYCKGFKKPVYKQASYSIGKGEDEKKKGMFLSNWVVADSLKINDVMKFKILDQILIGTSASPLKKALLDTGLGEDLVSSGFDGSILQPTYSIGLKGIDTDNAQKVKKAIDSSLLELCKEGLDKEIIESSINLLEFSYRENNTGGSPRGIVLMTRSFNSWLYGGDPNDYLDFEKHFKKLREDIASNKNFFDRSLGIN